VGPTDHPGRGEGHVRFPHHYPADLGHQAVDAALDLVVEEVERFVDRVESV
jgi:hypothetical protein